MLRKRAVNQIAPSSSDMLLHTITLHCMSYKDVVFNTRIPRYVKCQSFQALASPLNRPLIALELRIPIRPGSAWLDEILEQELHGLSPLLGCWARAMYGNDDMMLADVFNMERLASDYCPLRRSPHQTRFSAIP